MRFYYFIFFCFVIQMYGTEQSIKNWSNNCIIYKGFEQFIGNIDSYQSQPLVGGLSSKAPCLCIVNNHKYVTSVFEGSLDARQAKAAIHCLFAKKGIAPQIYHQDHHDDLSFIIMEFIDAPSLSFEQASNHSILDLVAQKVRCIAHSDLNVVTSNKENLFDEILRHYESIKNKNFINFDFILEEVKCKTEVIHQKINEQKRPLVLGHNDFHPRNMFFINNNIVIIDWDTVAPNYEFGDLVAYSVFSCLSAEDDMRLLSEYLQRIPSVLDKQYFKFVKLMARACLVLSFFELMHYIPESTKLIEDFKYYAVAFAQSTVFDSAEFFYECGMSQLQELRREYEKVLNGL